jgi:hypothetical protein
LSWLFLSECTCANISKVKFHTVFALCYLQNFEAILNSINNMQWLLLFILEQLIQRIVFLCVCFNGLLPTANGFDQNILIKKAFAYKANIYLYHIFKQTTFGRTSFESFETFYRFILHLILAN